MMPHNIYSGDLMKFTVRIGNEDREWNEDHDTNRENNFFKDDIFDECKTAEEYSRRMVQWFNDTLKKGEKPRHFVKIINGDDK